ncbi:MAG TPA: hypothetical protein VM598_09790 [Bdellovibrionota bacterium]|nr:hypothetical protein [Bdellovibrionota bacterium]
MRTSFLIALVLLGPGLLFSSGARAAALEIVYSSDPEPAWARQFDFEARDAYRWVTRWIPDSRAAEPLIVRFERVGGALGWVSDPLERPELARTLLIDESLIGSWSAKLVLIHELVHLLRHAANPTEVRWLDEGLANTVTALYAKSWPATLDRRLCDSGSVSLTSDPAAFSPGGDGYTGSFLFVHYLAKKLGGWRFISALAASRESGWTNIAESARLAADSGAISRRLAELRPEELWQGFARALFLNEPLEGEAFGLSLFDPGFIALSQRRQCHSKALPSGDPREPFIRFHATGAPQIYWPN